MNSININFEPDEEIVYIAKFHWIALVYSLFLFLISTIAILDTRYFMKTSDNFLIILTMFCLSLFGLVHYFKSRVIVTNKRYFYSVMGIKRKKGHLLSKIKKVRTYVGLFGGTLYLTHKEAPRKLILPISMIKNVKELEFKINQQIKLIAGSPKKPEKSSIESSIEIIPYKIQWLIAVLFIVIYLVAVKLYGYTGFCIAVIIELLIGYVYFKIKKILYKTY